jgi:hypothetical protein
MCAAPAAGVEWTAVNGQLLPAAALQAAEQSHGRAASRLGYADVSRQLVSQTTNSVRARTAEHEARHASDKQLRKQTPPGHWTRLKLSLPKLLQRFLLAPLDERAQSELNAILRELREPALQRWDLRRFSQWIAYNRCQRGEQSGSLTVDADLSRFKSSVLTDARLAVQRIHNFSKLTDEQRTRFLTRANRADEQAVADAETSSDEQPDPPARVADAVPRLSVQQRADHAAWRPGHGDDNCKRKSAKRKPAQRKPAARKRHSGVIQRLAAAAPVYTGSASAVAADAGDADDEQQSETQSELENDDDPSASASSPRPQTPTAQGAQRTARATASTRSLAALDEQQDDSSSGLDSEASGE